MGLSGVAPRVAAGADGEGASIGGITFDHAEQCCVVSRGVLRRLRFRRHQDAEDAARTALAALAVAASVLRDAEGCSYRSGCWLTAESAPVLESFTAHNEVRRFAPLSAEAALGLVDRTSAQAAEAGLAWEPSPLTLAPTD